MAAQVGEGRPREGAVSPSEAIYMPDDIDG